MKIVPKRSEIPVVILCGGKGLRIREVSELMPKPMLNIGERPVLWHIMKSYAHHGFKRFVLCFGYKGAVIRNYFYDLHASLQNVTLNYQGDNRPPEINIHGKGEDDLDWSVTLVETGAHTMTGGRVARAADYLDQNIFILTYGDGVSDIDISATVD